MVTKPKKTVQFAQTAKKPGIEEEKKEQLINDEESDENSQDEDEDQRNQLMTWRSNLITQNQDTVYIERFKGSPMSIEVSIFK